MELQIVQNNQLGVVIKFIFKEEIRNEKKTLKYVTLEHRTQMQAEVQMKQ